MFATALATLLLAACAVTADGQYKLRLAADKNFCVAPEGNWNGARLVLRPCSSSATRYFAEGYQMRFAESNKCIDVPDGVTYHGLRPHVVDCDGGGWQKWMSNGSGGTTYVVSPTWANQCLDVKDGAVYDGAEVQMWTCNQDSKNQRFKLVRW